MSGSVRPPSGLLRLLLWACAAFLAAMAAAHLAGLKMPGLFVYFDIPSEAYQDRIIAVGLFGHVGLILAATRDRGVLPFLLVAVWASVLGLGGINLSDDLASHLGGRSTLPYWLGTGALAGLAATITYLTFSERSRA